MVKRWITILLVLFACSARAWAGDVIGELEVDGVRYENVRWGPVNQGKVVMFHNRGATTVPLDRLPEEYARQLGYRPAASPDNPVEPPRPAPRPVPELVRPSAPRPKPVRPEDRLPPQERAAFDAACNAKMVLNGLLVNKSELTMLTGFIRSQAKVTGTEQPIEGWMLELAQRKHTDRPVPANMEMRPGLWNGTGEEVFLRDYATSLEQGNLVRLYAKEADEIKGYRTFVVAQDLTYEKWTKLR